MYNKYKIGKTKGWSSFFGALETFRSKTFLNTSKMLNSAKTMLGIFLLKMKADMVSSNREASKAPVLEQRGVGRARSEPVHMTKAKIKEGKPLKRGPCRKGFREKNMTNINPSRNLSDARTSKMI